MEEQQKYDMTYQHITSYFVWILNFWTIRDNNETHKKAK